MEKVLTDPKFHMMCFKLPYFRSQVSDLYLRFFPGRFLGKDARQEDNVSLLFNKSSSL